MAGRGGAIAAAARCAQAPALSESERWPAPQRAHHGEGASAGNSGARLRLRRAMRPLGMGAARASRGALVLALWWSGAVHRMGTAGEDGEAEVSAAAEPEEETEGERCAALFHGPGCKEVRPPPVCGLSATRPRRRCAAAGGCGPPGAARRGAADVPCDTWTAGAAGAAPAGVHGRRLRAGVANPPPRGGAQRLRGGPCGGVGRGQRPPRRAGARARAQEPLRRHAPARALMRARVLIQEHAQAQARARPRARARARAPSLRPRVQRCTASAPEVEGGSSGEAGHRCPPPPHGRGRGRAGSVRRSTGMRS